MRLRMYARYCFSMTNISRTGRGARSQNPDDVAKREAYEDRAKAMSDEIISNIIRVRDLRSLTNFELMNLLADQGWIMTPDTLSGILGRKRKSMPVSDIITFARALDVSLYAIAPMFFPDEILDRVRAEVRAEIVNELVGQANRP